MFTVSYHLLLGGGCLCSESLLKRAAHIARGNLLSFGTCFGKFTKGGSFRLHVTALDFLAPYAKVGTHATGLLIMMTAGVDPGGGGTCPPDPQKWVL